MSASAVRLTPMCPNAPHCPLRVCMRNGKQFPIEEDIHVPSYIRGPGVPAGRVLPYQGNLLDMAPTLLALAGKLMDTCVLTPC